MKYKTDDFTDWHICQAHLREPFPYRYPDLPPRFRLCRTVSRGIFLLQYASEAALFAGLFAGGVFLYALRRETAPPLLGAVVLLSVFLAFLFSHDIMALERFDPATRHMIVFDVLTHDSPVGWKGEKMRLFLTDTGYSKALENQEKGHIKIRNHAKVLSGDLHYDHKDRER